MIRNDPSLADFKNKSVKNSEKFWLDFISQNHKTAEKREELKSSLLSCPWCSLSEIIGINLGTGREVIFKSLKLWKHQFTAGTMNVYQDYATLSIYLFIHDRMFWMFSMLTMARAQWFLMEGDFALEGDNWQCLQTFLMVTGVEDGYHWHLIDRGQGCF